MTRLGAVAFHLSRDRAAFLSARSEAMSDRLWWNDGEAIRLIVLQMVADGATQEIADAMRRPWLYRMKLDQALAQGESVRGPYPGEPTT